MAAYIHIYVYVYINIYIYVYMYRSSGINESMRYEPPEMMMTSWDSMELDGASSTKHGASVKFKEI